MAQVHRSHTGIIHMTKVMPDTVFFVYPHMTHLDRQEVLQFRLPDATFINVFGNTEYRRNGFTVTNLIQTFFPDRRKVETEIVVPQEFTPFLYRSVQDKLFTCIRNFIKSRFTDLLITAIQFDHSHLRLIWMVTNLRGLYYRRIQPVFYYIRSDYPLDRVPGNTRRYLCPQNKPAVVMIHTSVIKDQVSDF